VLFGISYAEWVGYIVTIILVIAFGLPSSWVKRFEKYYSNDHLHRSLATENVSVVILCKGREAEETLSAGEQEKVITWFNTAKLVQKVVNPPLSSHVYLRIVNNDGEQIEILPYHRDFLVKRFAGGTSGKQVVYWAKQDDITRFLTSQISHNYSL
jgi:hypothetical protein